jgi:hypothetical protein
MRLESGGRSWVRMVVRKREHGSEAKLMFVKHVAYIVIKCSSHSYLPFPAFQNSLPTFTPI